MLFERLKIKDVEVIRFGKSLTIFDFDNINDDEIKVSPDAKSLIIDLSNTSEIDSFGVGILVRFMSASRSCNKKFSIVAIDNKVLFILKIDKLDKIVPIFPTLEDAINHLKD
ncbi:MAG: STAS domain-containing protein [Brevinematales bacterium]|nr:STAS domain-containing protein [Brevinematales bacterium]